MRWTEIASRLNQFGIGTKAIGWQPKQPDSVMARRLIRFLEDRLMLFNDTAAEELQHCLQSAEQIRTFVTKELGEMSDDSPLLPFFRAIRSAAREFMDHFPHAAIRAAYGPRMSLQDASMLIRLGQLRRDIGYQVAIIAIRWQIDVEADLARVLPDFE